MKTNISKDKLEYFLERYGTNGKFFLLTRDHPLTITNIGGGYGDVGWENTNCLYYYGNQVLYINDRSDAIDDFGRNLIDRSFIGICLMLSSYAPYINFKSLTAWKDGGKYLARVMYDDVDLEMEVEEMFDYFTKKLEEIK